MWTVTLTSDAMEGPHVETFDTEDEAKAFARSAKEWALRNRRPRVTARVRQAESLPVFEAVMDSLLGGAR